MKGGSWGLLNVAKPALERHLFCWSLAGRGECGPLFLCVCVGKLKIGYPVIKGIPHLFSFIGLHMVPF